jgi:Metallo-beta-lactamase superfamily
MPTVPCMPVMTKNARSVSETVPVGANSTAFSPRVRKMKLQQQQVLRIYDDPEVTAGYTSVPILEQDELPRGGVSVETAAVGRIQFGIPPETIKDSMLLGIDVPRIYIVPRERFCSDWGPALGINLAEFEFPAYFNYFVRQKKCCLVVDNLEAEMNIRSVFEETLLGPKKYRDHDAPLPNDDEDFDPDYPLDMRPNFYEEFQHFRAAEKTAEYEELNTDMLLDFYHFEKDNGNGRKSMRNSVLPSFAPSNEMIGIPPLPTYEEADEDETDERDYDQTLDGMIAHHPERVSDFYKSLDDNHFIMRDADMAQRKARFAKQPVAETSASQRAPRRLSSESVESIYSAASGNTFESMKSDTTNGQQNWMFSQIQWLGEVVTLWPTDATPEQIRKRNVPRVEIFKMPGNGTEYVVHDVDANNFIIGKARLRGNVRVPDAIAVEGFLPKSSLHMGSNSERRSGAMDDHSSLEGSMVDSFLSPPVPKALFHPPSFGVTVLGNSHGFDKNGSTSGYVLWINGRGIMIDPPPYSSATLEREGIRPQMIFGVIITHCHADHDAGAFQKILTGSRLSIITTPSIYKSFIRKYSALSGLSPTLLQHSHRFRSAIIGTPFKFQGATFHFTYTLHTIPCISFKVEWRGRSFVFTGDHLNLPSLMDKLEEKVRPTLNTISLRLICIS